MEAQRNIFLVAVQKQTTFMTSAQKGVFTLRPYQGFNLNNQNVNNEQKKAGN
jgi:hypothetical protein